MDRLACVDVPLLALQLLFHAHPEWKDFPTAVVDRDDARGVLGPVNEAAWLSKLRPGLRYTAALSIRSDLRAGTISREELHAGIASIEEALRDFSPRVEPSETTPGVFWVDASGLGTLYPEIERWAEAVGAALADRDFRATVVLGFSRFGTYAVARNAGTAGKPESLRRRSTESPGNTATRPVILILRNPEEERLAAARVPLARLDVAPQLRDKLARLGIHTVGAFLELPPEGLRRRFGEGADTLYRTASGRTQAPLEPSHPEAPLALTTSFDEPITSAGTLVFVYKRMLEPLLRQLASSDRGVSALELTLLLERAPSAKRAETVQSELGTAEPTLEEALILNLIHLRLEALELGAGVREARLTVSGGPVSREQLELFSSKPKRDLAAANRALARLRAELGDASILCAHLHEGHLPEARFAWKTLGTLTDAEPRNVLRRPLVRRILDKPAVLADPAVPYRRRTQDERWLDPPSGCGRIERMIGPYVVSGGWWRKEIRREYHFAETDRGELLWVYYDRVRRRWLLHGRIE